MQIEWFPENMTKEVKLEFIKNIPLEMKSHAHWLEMYYGTSYIVKNKDGTYDLYYLKDGELTKHVQE